MAVIQLVLKMMKSLAQLVVHTTHSSSTHATHTNHLFFFLSESTTTASVVVIREDTLQQNPHTTESSVIWQFTLFSKSYQNPEILGFPCKSLLTKCRKIKVALLAYFHMPTYFHDLPSCISKCSSNNLNWVSNPSLHHIHILRCTMRKKHQCSDYRSNRTTQS